MQIGEVRFVLLYGFDMLFDLGGFCCHLLLELAHLCNHLIDVVLTFLLGQFGMSIDGSHLFKEGVLSLSLLVQLFNLIVILIDPFLEIS